MTPKQKRAAIKKIRRLNKLHDQLERDVLVLLRKFTDAELKKMGMACSG